MKQIKRLIQFPINNGYKFDWDKVEEIRITVNNDVCIYWKFNKGNEREFYFSQNYIELITSKPFIEAVARGIVNKSSYEIHNEQWRNTKFYIILNRLIREDKVVDFLRNEISKAIFNEELPEFIDNLLWE